MLGSLRFQSSFLYVEAAHLAFRLAKGSEGMRIGEMNDAAKSLCAFRKPWLSHRHLPADADWLVAARVLIQMTGSGRLFRTSQALKS